MAPEEILIYEDSYHKISFAGQPGRRRQRLPDNAGKPDSHPGDRLIVTDSAILLFDTTHQALKGEASIIDGGFWCDVVPRPPDAMTALCGLAIEIHRV